MKKALIIFLSFLTIGAICFAIITHSQSTPKPDDTSKHAVITYKISGSKTCMVINYETDERITSQTLEKGEDAHPVLAVAGENWIFVGWSDGETNPYREDLNVLESFTVTAEFAEIIDGDDNFENGDQFPGSLPNP